MELAKICPTAIWERLVNLRLRWVGPSHRTCKCVKIKFQAYLKLGKVDIRCFGGSNLESPLSSGRNHLLPHEFQLVSSAPFEGQTFELFLSIVSVARGAEETAM